MGEFKGGDETGLLVATTEKTDRIYHPIFLSKYFAIHNFVKTPKSLLDLLAITIN